MSRLRTIPLAIAIVASLAACSRNSLPSDEAGGDTPPRGSLKNGQTGTQQSDWSAIVRLEDEAKKIAHTEGCTSSADCRSAAVGSRGCGGPRYYIPWCARTTDSAALFDKLAEVAKAEQAYNRKYNIMSTCEMRLPPLVEATGGSCTAK
jgi:hypothetical protein